jgi:hypothetical protein
VKCLCSAMQRVANKWWTWAPKSRVQCHAKSSDETFHPEAISHQSTNARLALLTPAFDWRMAGLFLLRPDGLVGALTGCGAERLLCPCSRFRRRLMCPGTYHCSSRSHAFHPVSFLQDSLLTRTSAPASHNHICTASSSIHKENQSLLHHTYHHRPCNSNT